MPGGGQKKDRKKVTQTDQVSKDKSSNEVDMARCHGGGTRSQEEMGGLTQKMMGLDDKAIEDVYIRCARGGTFRINT